MMKKDKKFDEKLEELDDEQIGDVMTAINTKTNTIIIDLLIKKGIIKEKEFEKAMIKFDKEIETETKKMKKKGLKPGYQSYIG